MAEPDRQEEQRRLDAKQEAEKRMREQLAQQMQERYNISPPYEKRVFEAGVSGAAQMKEGADYATYLQMQERALARLTELTRIQRKESEAYMDSLREIERLKGRELKAELEHFNLIKDRKQIAKDLEDLEKKGFERLRDEQQLRIKNVQTEAAQARAMERAGIHASTIAGAPGGIQTAPMDLMEAGRGNIMTRMATRGGIRGYLGRQYMQTAGAVGAAGGLSPSGLMSAARTMPVVSAVTAGYFAYRGLNEGRGLHIPGIGTVPFTDYQTDIARGQITGEGYRAGLAGRLRAFQMGANPLDTITSAVANSIVDAVRSQGFRGALGREFENSIKDIYKDTGLPVEQIAAMGELFARDGSLNLFRDQIQQLDEVARSTNTSVATVAETMQQFIDTLVGQGGVGNRGLPAAMTRIVQAIGGTAAQRQQTTAFFTQAGGLFTGLTPTVAQTPFGQQMMRGQLTNFLNAQRQVLEGMSPEQQQRHLGTLIDANLLPGVTSIDQARRIIMRGPAELRRTNVHLAQARVGGFFERAERRREAVHHDPNLLGRGLDKLLRGQEVPYFFDIPGAKDFMPGGFIWGDERKVDRAPERLAYIQSLERSLRGTKLSERQRAGILEPLRHVARSGGDWGEAVRMARQRADKFTEGNVQGRQGTINIKLDPAETRRLLGGKEVSKRVQLQNAAEGAARYVGTAFSDQWPF